MTTAGTNSRTPITARAWFACVLLAAATCAVYFNALGAPFIFDDLPRIANNENIRALWPPDGWLGDTRRPVVSLTLALNYALTANDVLSYHVVNILIHLASACCLLALIRTLGKSAALPVFLRENRQSIALGAALLWTVHPLNTQAVTYTIQRAESIMALFYLLVLLATARTALAENRRSCAFWIALAIIASSLGMASKGVMVTAPIAALLLDRTLFAGGFIRALRARWVLYAGLVLSWGVLLWLGVVGQTFSPETTSGTQRTVGFGFEAATPVSYLFTQAQVIPHYLRLAAWPSGLTFDYRWPFVTDFARAVVPGTLVLALLLASGYGFFKRAWWGLCGLLFFLILAPTSSLIPVLDAAVEHRMYLPLACITIIVSAGLHVAIARVSNRRAVIALAAIALISGALGLATIDRNRDYASSLAMWRDVVAKRPQNVRAWVGAGRALQADGNADDALASYERALVEGPGFLPALTNISDLLVERGNPKRAIELLSPLFAAGTLDAETLTNLGRAHHAAGDPASAARALSAAVELRPTLANAWYELAVVRRTLGDTARSTAGFETVIELAEAGEPSAVPAIHAAALTNLGVTRFGEGKADIAMELLARATRVDPANTSAWFNLAVASYESGDSVGALELLEHVEKLSPDHSGAARLQEIIRRASR